MNSSTYNWNHEWAEILLICAFAKWPLSLCCNVSLFHSLISFWAFCFSPSPHDVCLLLLLVLLLVPLWFLPRIFLFREWTRTLLLNTNRQSPLPHMILGWELSISSQQHLNRGIKTLALPRHLGQKLRGQGQTLQGSFCDSLRVSHWYQIPKILG